MQQGCAVDEAAVRATAPVAASHLNKDPTGPSLWGGLLLMDASPVFAHLPASILLSAEEINFQCQLSEISWPKCMRVEAQYKILKPLCALCVFLTANTVCHRKHPFPLPASVRPMVKILAYSVDVPVS